MSPDLSPESSSKTSPATVASLPLPAPQSTSHGVHPVPPPIPTERRRTRPPLASSSQPNATIPLNLEDLILEGEGADCPAPRGT